VRRTTNLRLIFVVLAALLLIGGVARADHMMKSVGLIDAWNAEISRIDGLIEEGSLGPLAIEKQRKALSDLVAQVTRAQETSKGHAEDVEALLQALGPAPGEGDPPEDADVAEDRKLLEEQYQWHHGNVQQMALTIRRAQHALTDLGKLNRSQLTERLLKPGDLPYDIDTWRGAFAELTGHAVSAFIKLPTAWVKALIENGDLRTRVVYLALVSLLFAVAVVPFKRWLRRRFGWRDGVEDPPYGDRLIAAVTEGACRGLIPVALVVAKTKLIGDASIAGYGFSVVIDAIARALAIFFIVYGVINAAFSPQHPRWRIMTLGDEASRLVVTRLKAALMVYLVFSGFYEAIDYRVVSDAFRSVYAVVFSVALYLSFAALLRRAAWTSPAAGEPDAAESASLIDRFRSLLVLGLLVLPVSALVGYPYLALFLANASVLTLIVLGCFWVARWLFRVGVAGVTTSDNEVAAWVRATLALRDEGAGQLAFWLNLVVDLVLLVAASALLLPVWGYGFEEAAVWLLQLFRGVQIGSFTLSLSDILVALLLFAVIMVTTRLIQRGLDRHLLPNLVRDRGVRDALKTGIGYLGVIIAALAAISAVGLDLTNLALVAGALSVGLGFGLQNVVNNFVSGLILLIERPIKQGDWVIAAGHEGTVKNINVRSTEIETFQRASVIVPNADLISSPVTNWTHKNHYGRVEIGVGVSYGSDPEQVRDILLEIGNAHPQVLKNPACNVYFKDFGASSLDFELRCFLKDIDYFIPVVSDLRYAIFKRFKEEGIEIPFPQRVVHMAPAPGAGPVPVSPEQAAREAAGGQVPKGEMSSDGSGES